MLSLVGPIYSHQHCCFICVTVSLSCCPDMSSRVCDHATVSLSRCPTCASLQEYQVEDLDGAELPPRLPAEKVRELQALGLW